MSFAAVEGVAVSQLTATVPDYGCWWLDATLVEPADLSGLVTVTLADKTLVGTVVAGAAFEGRAAYRIVGGHGGWGSTLPKKPYRNDLGVSIGNVIADAATACGEEVDIDMIPTTRVGPHFARAEAAASAVLHLLTPRAWHVAFDGVTKFGTRSSVAYTGDGARTRVVPDGSIVEVVTDTIGDLMPGVTIDGSAPATDVEYLLSGARLTVRVYAGTRQSRRSAALRKIFEALFPWLRYAGTYEFRVVSQTGERLNLQPLRSASGMPDLAGVPVRPGTAGLKSQVALGEHVLVVFADNDPSRPQVIAHQAADAPGWMPIALQLGEAPALGAARVTDPVVCGPFGGSIVGGSARVTIST